MKAITLDEGGAEVFASAALSLKYDDPGKPVPITESQILMLRRFDDRPINKCARHAAPFCVLLMPSQLDAKNRASSIDDSI